MISNSLEHDFIQGDIQGWLYKNVQISHINSHKI